MAEQIDWMIVKGLGDKPIGAVGFIGNDAVAIASFFADADGNQDGNVSWGEWIAYKISPLSIEGYAVVQVAMAAKYDLDILSRDASVADMANKMFLNFASGLVAQGIYVAYFSRGVSAVGGGIASKITSDMIKGFVIRKGFEAAVKRAFLAAAKPSGG